MECYETCVDRGNKCAIFKKKLSCTRCGKLKPYFNLPRDICNICPSKSACTCSLDNLKRRNTCRCERTCWQWFLNLFGLAEELPEHCKQSAETTTKTPQAQVGSTEVKEEPCEPLKLEISKCKEGYVTPCHRFGARTRSFICERSSRTSCYQDLSEKYLDSCRSICPDEYSQSQKKETGKEDKFGKEDKPGKEDTGPPEILPVNQEATPLPAKTPSATSATRGRGRKRGTSKGKGKRSRSSSRDKKGVRRTSSSSSRSRSRSTGSKKGKVKKTASSSSATGKDKSSISLCSFSKLFRKVPATKGTPCPRDPIKVCSSIPLSLCSCPPCSEIPPSTDKSAPSKVSPVNKRSDTMVCPGCYLGCYSCDKTICTCFSCRSCNPGRSCCTFSKYSACCPSSCSTTCKLPCRSQSFHSTLMRSPSPVPVCIPKPCGTACTSTSPCGRSRCRLPKSLCPIVCRKSRSCPRPCLCPIKSSYCSPPPCCRSCCPKLSTHPYVSRANVCGPGCCKPCCKPPISNCPPCCTKACCLPCPRSFSVYPYCPRPRQYRVLSSIPKCVTGRSCPCPPGRCSCPLPSGRPYPKPCCNTGCATAAYRALGCTSNASSYINAKQDDAVCQQLISKYSFSKPLCRPCPFPCYGAASCVSPGSACNPGGGCKSCVPFSEQRRVPKGYEPCDYTHSRKPPSPGYKSPKMQPVRFTTIPCSREPLCEFFLAPHCIRKSGPRSPVREFLDYAKVPKLVKRKRESGSNLYEETLSTRDQTQTEKGTEQTNDEVPTSTGQPKKTKKGTKGKAKKRKSDMNESARYQNVRVSVSTELIPAESKNVELIEQTSSLHSLHDSSMSEERSSNNNYGDKSDEGYRPHSPVRIDFTNMKPSKQDSSHDTGERFSRTSSPINRSRCSNNMYSSFNTSFDLQTVLSTHPSVSDIYTNRSICNHNVNAWDPVKESMPLHRRGLARPVITVQSFSRYSAHPFLEQEIDKTIQQIKQKQDTPSRRHRRSPHYSRRLIISPSAKNQVVDEEFIRDSWARLRERAAIREEEIRKMKSMGLTEEQIEDIIANAEPEKEKKLREQKQEKSPPSSKPDDIVFSQPSEIKHETPQPSAGLTVVESVQQIVSLKPLQKESSVDGEPQQLVEMTPEKKEIAPASKASVHKSTSPQSNISQTNRSVPVFQSLFDRFEETVQIFVRTKSGESQTCANNNVADSSEIDTNTQPSEAEESTENDISENKAMDSQGLVNVVHTSPPSKPVAARSSPEDARHSLLTACSCQTLTTQDTSSTSVTNMGSRSGYSDHHKYFICESADTFVPTRPDVMGNADMPCLSMEESGSLSPGSRFFYAQDRSCNSAETEDSVYEYPRRQDTSPYACGDLGQVKRPFHCASKESSVDLADYTDDVASTLLLATDTVGSSVDPLKTAEVSTQKQVKGKNVAQPNSSVMFQKVEDNCDVEAIKNAKAAFFNKMKNAQESASAATAAKGGLQKEPVPKTSRTKVKEKGRETKHSPTVMSQVMIDQIRTNGTPV